MNHLGDELSALLDGELDPAEAAEARAHLSTCAYCTAELAAIDRTRSLVRSLPTIDPAAPLRPRDDQPAVTPPPRWLPAAAAAVALLLLLSLPGDGTDVSPSLAALTSAHAATSVADAPVAAHMRFELPTQGDWDEFDMVPVVKQVPMPKKYTVTTEPGATVAQRAAIVAVVKDDRGKVVEEVAVDEQTGLVLRRTVYDDAGRVVRRSQVDWVDGAATARKAYIASPTSRVQTPARLDGDYERVGVYRTDDVVHLLFSDGLHALSVFAEAGQLDAPDGGRAVDVGGRRARHYARPGGEVLLWEAGGVVYTAVGDGPVEDVMRAVASVPGPKSRSMAERLRRNCRDLAESLS